MLFHEIKFGCPTCNMNVQIREVLCAADGDICINGTCPKCRKPRCFQTDMGRILTHCRKSDAEDRPKQLTSGFTEEDKKLLGEMNISEEE